MKELLGNVSVKKRILSLLSVFIANANDYYLRHSEKLASFLACPNLRHIVRVLTPLSVEK